MSNSSEVKEIFRNLDGGLEKTLIHYREVYERRYPNPGTRDVNFTRDIRSIISKRFGYNSPEHLLAKKIAALEKDEKYALKKKSMEKVYDNLNKRIIIKKVDIIRIVDECVESDDVYMNAIALLVCSGGRQYEILELSDFEKVNSNTIRQKNIAKSKSDLVLTKPLIIIDSNTFLRLLSKVRDNIVFNKNTVNNLNKIFKELFKQTLHFARKIYGSYSYVEYGGDEIALSVWLNKVLGHSEEALGSANNYSNILIK